MAAAVRLLLLLLPLLLLLLLLPTAKGQAGCACCCGAAAVAAAIEGEAAHHGQHAGGLRLQARAEHAALHAQEQRAWRRMRVRAQPHALLLLLLLRRLLRRGAAPSLSQRGAGWCWCCCWCGGQAVQGQRPAVHHHPELAVHHGKVQGVGGGGGGA